jgi:rod shape-determining protein MreC
MFRKGSSLRLRTLIYLTLSTALIIFDQRSDVFHAQRMQFSSAVAYPFQLMVDTPIRFFNWVSVSMTTQDRLVHENEELRVREILLQSRLQKLLVLEKENAQLRQLLQSTSQIAGRVAVARILAVSLDPNILQVVLDKGNKDQVYPNQPVLDGSGVIGQVVGVGAQTSRVLLVTDKQSAVPVEDYRNGIRAIAVGTGVSGQLTLINIPDTSDIQAGDLFVTSGLDLHYPVGYPVGMVAQIESQGNNPVKKVMLSPMAHLNQAEQVLLAWPSKQALTEAVEKELQNTQSQSQPESDVDAKDDAKSETKSDADIKSESKLKLKSKSKAKADIKSKSKTELKSQVVS